MSQGSTTTAGTQRRPASQWLRAVERRWEAYAQPRSPVRTALFVALLSVGLSISLYAPSLWIPLPARFADFAKLCAWPLARDLQEPILAYRITAPLLAYLLGLRGSLGLAVQYGANVVTFLVLYLALFRRIGHFLALLTCLGLALTPVAQLANTWPGFPDSVTNLALAGCLLTASPLTLAGLTCAGVLNDERFILGLPFVVLWHFGVHWSEGRFGVARRAFIGALGGVALASVVRAALDRGIIGAGIPATVYAIQFNALEPPHAHFWGAFFGFRFMWLLPLVAAGLGLRREADRLGIFALLALVIGAAVATTRSGDLSRSMAPMFPGIVWSVVYVYRHSARLAGGVLMRAVVLCVITPQFSVVADQLQWLRPLPLSFLRWWRPDLSPF